MAVGMFTAASRVVNGCRPPEWQLKPYQELNAYQSLQFPEAATLDTSQLSIQASIM
jgi:hypothetical protein